MSPRTSLLVLAASLVGLLPAAASLSAQGSTGTISGRVVDVNKRPMPGATVRVDSTNLVARADDDGRFRLQLVPAGRVTLEARSLGYTPARVPATVQAGVAVTVELELKEAVRALAEVKIEGQREGQARALTKQQSADNVKNVVSSDVIGRTPDINSAEALSRISGVAITRDQGEGRFVSVRGTAPEYTSVAVNGERLPSPSRDVRSVQLDAIMPDALASIEVSKTLTADMDGDAIGGAVNLITKTPEPGRTTLNLTASGGQTLLREKPMSQFGGTLGTRFGTSQRLGLLLSASAQTTNRGSDDVEGEWSTVTIGGTPKQVLTNFETRFYSQQRKRASYVGSLDYRYAENGTIALRTNVNQFSDDEDRFRAYRLRSGTFQVGDSTTNGRIENSLRDRRIEQLLGNVQLAGTQGFGRVTTDYSLSYGFANNKDPKRNEVVFRQSSVNYKYNLADPETPQFTVTKGSLTNPALYLFNQFQEIQANVTDHDRTARANAMIPISAGRFNGSIKFGGMYRDKEKVSTQNTAITTGFTGTRLSLDSVSRTLTDAKYFNSSYPLASPITDEAKLYAFLEANKSRAVRDTLAARVASAPLNFNANEQVSAGYVMATLDFGRLRVLPGVRVEHTSIDLTGNKLQFSGAVLTSASSVTNSSSYSNVLPSISAWFKLDDYSNLRIGINKSLLRPNYVDVRPYERPDLVAQTVVLGNPDLKATTALNIDIGAERFFRSIGIIGANYFYKDLSNYIATVVFRQTEGSYAGYLATQPRQGSGATISGFEVNWQQQLIFLPGLLNGLGINANYTHATSSSVVPPVSATDTSKRKAPFLGQVPTVYNVAVSYERGRLQSRLALNVREKFLDTYGISSALDFYTANASQLDFSGNVLVYRGLRVFAEANNLTNQPLQRFLNSEAQFVQQEYYRPWGSIGLRWSR